VSKTQLDEFVKFASNDPAAFQEAVGETQDPEEFLRNVHRYARDQGYDITEEEGKVWIADDSSQCRD